MNVTNEYRKHKSYMLMLVTDKMDKFDNIHIYYGEMECYITIRMGQKQQNKTKQKHEKHGGGWR